MNAPTDPQPPVGTPTPVLRHVAIVELACAPSRSMWGEIVAERQRAHCKHGATSMESCDPMSDRRLRVLVEEVGECARVLNDREHALVDPDEPSWADIDDRATEHLRAELVQVAAMAVAWIAALDGEALS